MQVQLTNQTYTYSSKMGRRVEKICEETGFGWERGVLCSMASLCKVVGWGREDLQKANKESEQLFFYLYFSTLQCFLQKSCLWELYLHFHYFFPVEVLPEHVNCSASLLLVHILYTSLPHADLRASAKRDCSPFPVHTSNCLGLFAPVVPPACQQ